MFLVHAQLAHRLLERAEHQLVEFALDAFETRLRLRRLEKPPAEIVLAETHVTPLVRDDAFQHLPRDGVGRLRVMAKDRVFERLENHVLHQHRRFPVLLVDEFEQAVLERDEALVRALADFAFRILHAQHPHAVQQHLKMPCLVDDLRREKYLGLPVGREPDHGAGGFQCGSLAHGVVAQRGDEAVALARVHLGFARARLEPVVLAVQIPLHRSEPELEGVNLLQELAFGEIVRASCHPAHD